MKSTQTVPPLRRKFYVPPFTVLSVGADYWKSENQKWADRGLTFHPRQENFVLDSGELEMFGQNCNRVLESHLRLRAHLKAFCIVPTTVWSARGGFWQKLKKIWIHERGLRGGKGREQSGAAFNISPNQLPGNLEFIKWRNE